MAENQNDPLGILKPKADPLNILQKPKTAPIIVNEPPAQPPASKYQKAVNDDRSRVGKLAATIYNGLVGSLESFAGFGAEAFGALATSIPSPQYDIGGNKLNTTIYDLTPEQQAQAKKELKKSVKQGFGVIKSGYVSREDEKKLQGQFDVTNGIGLEDIEGLVAMSGRMAGDIGLGAATGGSSYFMQAYSDAVDDYDESVAKMGIKENPNARALYGVAGGTINGLLEKFAIDKIVGSGPVFKNIQKKVLANVLKNTANLTGKAAIDAIETAAKQEIKALTSGIKQNGLKAAYRSLVEAGTEGVQAGLEDAAKFATNWAQGVDVFNEKEIKDQFFKNMLNSAAAGGVFGPVIGLGMDKTFGQNVNTQVLKDIAEANTPEQLAVINDELAATFDENNFTQEERDAVMANANRYAQIKQTLPQGTSAIAQTIAIPLIENRIKLDNEIQTRKNNIESVDEALKADEEASISLLEDKRAQINDDIREVVNDEKFNYFEKDGKFFKQLGENAPEEISRNRFDLQQIKTGNYATQTSEGTVQEGGTTGNIGQRQGTQEAGTQGTVNEADTGYRYIVSEEGSEFPITALVNKKVRKDGRPAILYQDGQRVVARILGTNRIEDVGNVVEMMDALPQDFGIEVDETVVTETPTGYRVEGEDMVNDNENPLDAISVDQNGKVMNVALKTPSGKRRKFRGQAAQDLAYQITLKETLKNEDEFELFLEQEHQAELDAAEAKAAAEAETTAANEPVPTTQEPAPTEPTTTEPVAGQRVTTEPTYGRFTARSLFGPAAFLEGYNKLQRKVLKDAKNVLDAINFILKTQGKEASINLHDQKSFESAVIEAGGSKEDSTSRGFYMDSDGSIHLNMDNIASDTMLHEGFHPMLDFLESKNPAAINDLFAQLEKLPGAEGIIAQARATYTGDVTQKKEAITDFVAGVADGRVALNPSNYAKIRKFILDMLNKIGIGKGGGSLVDVKNAQGLIKLAEFITEKFTKGDIILPTELLNLIKDRNEIATGEQGLVAAAGELTPERISDSKIGNVNPLQFSRPEKFKEVETVTLPSKSMMDVYNEFGGNAVAINSDPTRVGNLVLPSGKEIFMYGGLNYTALKPNVDGEIGFASTRISKPEQVSRIMNTLFSDRNGEGVVLVAAQKPDSMLGNAYALEYTLDAITQLPKKILRSAEFKDEFFGKDIAAIKEAFGEKEYSDFVKKYRGADLSNPDVMEDMIETLLTDIGNNFIARNSMVSNMLAGVVEKSTRSATKGQPGYVSVTPNKFIAKALYDRLGLNQEKLFYEIGEKGIVDEYMNKGNWGFVTTGFTSDGKIDPNTIQDKGVIHPQFNAKFHGKNPFILDGAYLIDKLFPPEDIIAKTGKPYTKKASLMVAGSMYPKGTIQKLASPDTKGVPQFQKAPTKPITKERGGIIKKGFKEQVRYGILGKENVRLKELMSGELSAELATAETRVKETMKTIKKYGGSVTEKDISDFMQGNSNGNQIPLDLATQLSEMRAQIDGLTERLIQLGVVDSQESIDYYRDNMGKYMLRSYESINFKDTKTLSTLYGKGLNIDNVAKKLKNVDKTVVDAALKYLSDRAKAADPTLTDAEAMKIARADANEILSDSEDYIMNKGLTGSTNVKSLRQRKDISPEIRALMGEYTDPLYNYYSTVFKIASLTSSRQYLNSLKEFGMGNFFFENKTEDATVKFAGDESDALAPLNGIWTFPEIKESLQIAQKETTSLYAQMAGRVRMLKTVYNPSTHVKNIIGNMGFAVSNGHWNSLPEAYKYIKGSIKGGSNKEVMQMMDTLNRYGVLNNVIGVGELKSYFDNNESIDDFLKTIYNNANQSTTASKLGKAKANLSKIPKAIEKAYAIEDDVFKILAFVNESNRYAQAKYNKKYDKLSDTEKKDINEIASEIVKDTFPTFSRVPKGVKTLSKFAFLGNFLSFPVESVRTQYNSLALARKEIKSGNTKLRRVGIARLSGAIAYNSIFSTLAVYAYNLAGAGLTGALGAAFGDDEKESTMWDSIKKYLAPWNKNSEVYVSKFRDGKLEYYDIGSLDSYGYQRRVWNAFWSTKNKGEFDKMMASSISEALDPWMAVDMVYSNLMSIARNDDGLGGKVYNPEAKPMDRSKEIAIFVGKQFGPGALGSAIKIADAYQKGETDKVMDEFGAQVFARRYSVDLNKQFQNYIYTEGTKKDKEVGFKDRLSDARNIYLDAKRQNLDAVDLSRKYQEALDQYKEILLTANGYYKAALMGGTNPKVLIQSLVKSRVGRAEAIAIVTGAFGKYDQAYIRK